MCEVVAKKMLATVTGCKLFPKSQAIFTGAALRKDCHTMWDWYIYCVKDRPDVGRGIAQSGLKPLEAVRPEMKRLYTEHQKNVGR